jgi:hypothetical protein
MSPAEPRPASRRALLLGGALLLAQAANFALVESSALANQRRLAAPDPAAGLADAARLPLAGYRALAELAPLIPEDGRVLLVADNATPVAWDFQLLPRPLHVLFLVDESLEARVARLDPALGERVMRWHAEIRARDQQLTPDALRRRMAQADWLLVVRTSGPALELPADGPRREELRASGPITLYRLVPP